MKEVIAILDVVANSLESKGLIKEAEMLDAAANSIEAGMFGKVIGGAALALLSMIGSLQAEGTNQNRIKNDVEAKLIDIQSAKTKDVLDAEYHDLVRYLSKLNAGQNRNKLIDQAEEVRKDTLKKLPKGLSALA